MGDLWIDFNNKAAYTDYYRELDLNEATARVSYVQDGVTYKIQTPWNGNYHTDVNVEMNHWPAEVTNLSECHLPLFDLIASLVDLGTRTARIQYNKKGWVVHPITNVWGYTSPGEYASWGMHTVLQYKEVNEALLRTPNSGGSQLLGLADFPGQGSAFVGILDAFWDSKGLVSPEKYRESCAPTVLLARMPKRAYVAGETFRAKMEIYHYGQYPLKRGKLKWELKDEQGTAITSGSISTPAVPCATLDSLGVITIPLQDITKAQKLTLHTTLDGKYHNEWDIWAYPEVQETASGDFVYARTYNAEVKQALAQGKNVLLVPEQLKGRKTKFASRFWNSIMLNWDPMIVGTLIDSDHPAFSNFPTDSYADWQWWDILNYAAAMELDEFRNVTPVIQTVDAYEHNHKLGIAFEARVDKGSLFVLNVDIDKDAATRPAMRQLLYSVRKYVASDAFRPAVSIQPYQLDALFDNTVKQDKGTSENAAVKQLLNQ